MPSDLTQVSTPANSPRRRSEKSRTAIVTATRELLLERGFDGLTIEAVAARAGVGKQTIYRWWPSRPALVADVMLEDADKLLSSVNSTAVKLRAGFSAPLHDRVRARLLADGIDAATAESAADAIVGGVVYPILSGAQPYSRRRAERTTRLIVDALTGS